MSCLRFKIGDAVRIVCIGDQFNDRVCTISAVFADEGDEGWDYEVDFGPDHLDGHTGNGHDRPSYYYVDDHHLEFADIPIDIPPITDDDFAALLGG